MTSNFRPDDRRKREILVVALAEFSHQCEAPDLTPECPFFELTHQGPMCAEQCMDLLAEHGGAPEDANVVRRLGDYEIRRRVTRPRRDPAPTAPPFDAAQIELMDKDKPTTDKRTVALVRELRNLLLEPPELSDDSADREYRIRANWAELVRRGVSVDDIVRYALAPMLAIAAIGLALSGGAPGDHSERVVAWRSTAEAMGVRLQHNGGEKRQVELTAQLFMRLAQYFSQVAAVEEIIQFSPPSLDRIPEQYFRGAADRRAITAQWLHDRLTQTYVDDWVPQSRAMEWNYLHGKERGCCPSKVMRERYVSPLDLHQYLADAGSASLLQDNSDPSRPKMRTTDFARLAATYLREGKYDTAANLFQAILQVDPNDRMALNNLGFCLLPTAPREALNYLRKAESQGNSFDATVVANLVLALHLGGYDEEALAVADRAMPDFSRVDSPAWLWLHKPDKPLQLTSESVDVETYVRELRRHIAGAPGDAD